MRFGLGVTARAAEVDAGARLNLARAADELGLDSVWVPDHPVFATDCWTTLTAYALATRRIRVGPIVSCNLYRSALMTARQAADVDRFSGGRVVLGIGAGWLAPEFDFMGVPFPEPGERMAALTRTLRDLPRYWYGEHVDIDLSVPAAERRVTGQALRWPPVQQPRVPLLIGGSGDLTLRRVAQHADMCNFEDSRAPTAEDVRARLAALRGHCQTLGRPYESIVKSYFVNGVVLAPTDARVGAKVAALGKIFAGAPRRQMCTPAGLVEMLRPIAAEGIDYFVVNLTGYEDLETVELLTTAVAPALQGLTR
jgi:alkanesulfonate monooxygenase SsuD/methylene tetrahydromethanopterin reductase-like flavin-dependent oxidoreductase (luciferase family)